MKLTKKIETEITQFLQTYWDTYFEGNLSQWQSFVTEDYKNIGTNQEEIWNNKKEILDYTNEVLDQMVGNAVVRNKTVQIIPYDPYIMTHELGDLYIKNGKKWTFYAPIRLSSLIQKQDTGWIVLHQHGSFPDSKTQKGEAFAVDAIKAENVKLQKAVQKRTIELEQKNRELEVETALERIRAQAVAMKESSDLLDIVVSMRNEFIKLGHEAHYFWHMMWLPKTYEKAMTSGDGSKIGFVMELPRHIHGDIPQLAKWEKSKKQTVVYTMNVEEAIDYVDKMVALGNFKSIDPQAPSHDDIKHIGGLTFIMARTTHGEIGYSLPGIVNKPPKEDVDILVKFAGAFDLAHQRFLDLQKAEKQARETQIELSLERIRSRVTAMQESSDLFDIVVTMRNEFLSLGHEADYFWHMKWTKDNYEMSMTAEDGGRLGMVITVPKFVHEQIETLHKWEESNSPYFVLALNGKDAWDYIEKMNTYGKYQLVDPHAPSEEDILHIGGLTFIIARTTHGEIGFSLAGKIDNPPKASIDILVRFASVFDLAYKRFEDLKKTEAQARETQIELALEKVRSRTMAMQKGEEVKDVVVLLYKELIALGVSNFATCGYVEINEETNRQETWVTNPGGDSLGLFYLPLTGDVHFDARYEAWKKQQTVFHQTVAGKERKKHLEYAITTFNSKEAEEMVLNQFPDPTIFYCFNFSHGYLHLVSGSFLKEEEETLLARFTKVFEQTYARFLDLEKAEAQAKEAQIEAALERVRSSAMAMHKSDDLTKAVDIVFSELKHLGFNTVRCGIGIFNDQSNNVNVWTISSDSKEEKASLSGDEKLEGHPLLDGIYEAWTNQVDFSYTLKEKDLNNYYKVVSDSNLPVTGPEEDHSLTTQYYHAVVFPAGGLYAFSDTEFTEDKKLLMKRFGEVFHLSFTRHLDLKQSEAQAREAQIEMALEKVRSRTMAMQNSNELPEAANNLFLQVQELGIPAWSAGYCIWEDDQKSASCNMSSEGEIQKSFSLPTIGEGYNFYKPLKNGESFHVAELGGEKLVKHYDFMKTLPIVGEVLEDFSKKGIELPTFQIFHIVYFTHGYLMFITYEAVPSDWEVFKRFGKVFQQTFTRFLDLQKAEAQTREAQIEAALERTRTQSMLMQHSNELNTTAQVFHEQLQLLGIDSEFSYLWLPDETEKNHKFWATWSERKKRKTIYKNKAVTFPLDKSEPSIEACYVAWESGETVHVNPVQPDQVEDYFNTWSELLNGVEKFKPELFQDGLYYIDAYMDYGCFGIMIKRELEDDEKNILSRFSKEFQRTYTRFLDLQKAEAQTRAAQINLAVERVRAKALAMHKSEEIIEVVAKLKDEVMALDIPDVIAATIFLNAGEDKVRMWDLSTLEKDSNGYEIPFDITFKLKKRDPNLYVKRVWENQEDYFLEVQEAKDLKRIVTWLRENNKVAIADEVEDYTKTTNLKRLHHAVKKLNNGKLVIDLLNPPSIEMESILTKMGAAFDLAYKRFEDLKKAESQARESQIEAALEKVRSRSLAMHKPDELQEVVAVVAEKLKELGVIFDAGGVILCTYFPDNKDVVHWITVEDFSTSGRYFDNPIFSEAWDSKNRGDAFFSKEFSVEAKNDFFKQAFEHSDYCKMPDDYKQFVLQADSHNLSAAWSKNSAIIIPSLTGAVLSESDAEIMKRFAKVFEQAYIRFMDLQKAEAQTRESQIEAALERVRSRSMAMHKSEEMLEVIEVVAKQLLQLNLKFETVSFGKNNQEGDFKFWIASKGQPKPMLIQVPFINSRVLNSVKEAQKKGINFIEDVFNSEENKEWSEHLIKFSELKNLPQEAKDFILNAPGFARSSFLLKSINLYVGNYRAIPFTKEENAIFSRFAHVFEQAYTRFLDLKKSEAQAREAQIEASLERVRSRTLAMQTSDELAETSVIVFKQLLELGIAPNRLFIGIVKSDNDTIEAWTTNEDGSKLAVHFSPQASKNKFIKKMLDGWKQQKQSLVIDMKGKELEAYFKYLNEDMKIPFIDGLKQKRRVQTIAYFSGGLIGMAAPVEQPDDTIHLLERFAAVFNLTYTRFKDLKIAEANAEKAEQDLIKLQAAKKSAEEALSELQLTQNQLIQSEKMASLGELTAGIAHEIQNPLNFVNNFSEVSKELLDEMLEEIENGDMEEVKAIMDDVIQNLEKINHHGKRADGIVKGMLQHSRSSTGTKEPTNINVLGDEYLRLAYHGLRAKDKSFNATLVTDFDDTIGNINIIPQDIGRVVLNLLTNAFYVVNEKKQNNKNSYEPTVSLTTKKNGDWVTISVKDNGNGIPKHVLDKIFQPFFTTKPTGQGTGLGLSMSYDIVTKGHGGELKVNTVPNKGTEFIIELPNN